jgi:cytochrome c oxidase subunit 2
LVTTAVTALLATAAQAHDVNVGAQDMLHAAGPQSGHILDLWRLTLLICTVVFALVLLAFLYAVWKAPKADETTPVDTTLYHRPEPKSARHVGWAIGISGALLLVLVGASVWTDRALASLALKDALHLKVTAHQWWWEIEYDDADPSRVFTTANEIHVPVGRPVIVTLKSDDVIHSLWVPNLAGKKDLIPGRTTELNFRADQPGVYRGQCAEFCGYQHAQMAFAVFALQPADYEAWAAKERAPASPPATPELQHGQQVFMNTTCVMCHNIGGTDATARKAPDLTHFGSRTTIASGALFHSPEQLAQWIADPAKFKPGANMPGHTFSAEDLHDLVAYLESLK